MQIPQIQITTTDIQMDRTITDPVLKIQQPNAEVKISQPAATLEINMTNAKLDINMDQMWRDLGLKPTGELISDYAQKGRQESLKGILKRVKEGDQMMNGAGRGQGRATIQNIAKQNHGPHRPGPYNIKFIPSYGSVDVNVTPGTTDINVTRHDPKIDVQVNKPIMDFTYGTVRGKMTVRSDIQIDVIG